MKTDRRHKDDWYPTPPEAVEALLSVETFSPVIWEPAAGDGSLAEVLQEYQYSTICSDLNDYGFCEAKVDFLLESERRADSLITNPPYRLADDFVRHAIELGCTKHAWLLRLAFLEGGKRHETLFKEHPPCRVHVFSKRLTMWRGDFIRSNEPVMSKGTIAYAWFVWEAGFAGKPEVSWI